MSAIPRHLKPRVRSLPMAYMGKPIEQWTLIELIAPEDQRGVHDSFIGVDFWTLYNRWRMDVIAFRCSSYYRKPIIKY